MLSWSKIMLAFALFCVAGFIIHRIWRKMIIRKMEPYRELVMVVLRLKPQRMLFARDIAEGLPQSDLPRPRTKDLEVLLAEMHRTGQLIAYSVPLPNIASGQQQYKYGLTIPQQHAAAPRPST